MKVTSSRLSLVLTFWEMLLLWCKSQGTQSWQNTSKLFLSCWGKRKAGGGCAWPIPDTWRDHFNSKTTALWAAACTSPSFSQVDFAGEKTGLLRVEVACDPPPHQAFSNTCKCQSWWRKDWEAEKKSRYERVGLSSARGQAGRVFSWALSRNTCGGSSAPQPHRSSCQSCKALSPPKIPAFSFSFGVTDNSNTIPWTAHRHRHLLCNLRRGSNWQKLRHTFGRAVDFSIIEWQLNKLWSR